MTNKPKAKQPQRSSAANVDDLRDGVMGAEFETNFNVHEKTIGEVSEGKIFGLAAGERMILSVILFLAVSVLSVALLFATNTIQLP